MGRSSYQDTEKTLRDTAVVLQMYRREALYNLKFYHKHSIALGIVEAEVYGSLACHALTRQKHNLGHISWE